MNLFNQGGPNLVEAFLHGMRFRHVSQSVLNSFHKRFMGALVVNLFMKSVEKFRI